VTMQIPERILVDGRPRRLLRDPLYRLLASRRMQIEPPDGRSTACHRRYVGTWEIVDGHLWLLTLSTMAGEELALEPDQRRRFLAAVPATDFPVRAHWFNDYLVIPLGRCLLGGNWNPVFEQNRIVRCRGGRVVRDHLLDGRRLIRRKLARQLATEEDARTHYFGRTDVDAFERRAFVERFIAEREAEADRGGTDDDWLDDWWPPELPGRPLPTGPRPWPPYSCTIISR
jgi:hypothetical protein